MTTPRIFERNYYQRIRDTEEIHWWSVGMRDLMAAWLNQALAGSAPLRALDVGCGTGLVVNWLRRYPLASEPVGIDLSAHALAFGRQCEATALGLATANRLPFPAAHFDLIVCLDTLQHVSPRGADRETIFEFARVLRRGGYLYLRTNSALGHAPLRGADPNLYRRYLLRELSDMLDHAGLEIRRASYANCLMSTWAMLQEYSTVKRINPAIGPGLAIQVPKSTTLNTILRSTLRCEAWLTSRLGLCLPFGHSIVVLARKP